MSQIKLLTAIIYCNQPQVNGNQFLKYRKISDTTAGISKFLLFAAKFPGAQYVNFYYRDTKKFKERIHLQ